LGIKSAGLAVTIYCNIFIEIFVALQDFKTISFAIRCEKHTRENAQTRALPPVSFSLQACDFVQE
jgi:hypothetical protein